MVENYYMEDEDQDCSQQVNDGSDWFGDYEMHDYEAELTLTQNKSQMDEPKLTKKASYNFIKEEEIEPRQQKRIFEITDTLGVSEEIAKSLLLKYRWDKEEVINRFTDYDNLLLKVFNYDMSKSVKKAVGSFLCPVCYEQKQQPVSLECGHSFCRDCFSDYLENSVKNGPDSVFSTCPQAKCLLIVPDTLFQNLCSAESFKKYRYYLKKSFIDVSKTTKWCPAPNCKYAVEYPSMKMAEIICKCDYDWCFKCLKKAHRPINCELLAKWYEKIQGSEDDTSIWIKLNTKPCPKCKVQIQKNQGCMHMTCS